MLATPEIMRLSHPSHRIADDVPVEDEPRDDAVPCPPEPESEPGMDRDRRAASARQRRLASDLTRAVAGEAFVLHYHPRVALADGAWTGAEALIRWPHRRKGLVPPDAFLPLAERMGQISRIGGWVLRTACAQARGGEMASVSVNVSARQLADGVLLDQVAEALEFSGLDPERLELEFTETTLVEFGFETLLTLSAIRDLGVGLALDDFGTGFASLAMLKRLPLTAMKLDGSLVRDLPGEREDAAIVRAVIATGHALGLTVVAEGIETEAQRAFLSANGCDEGQGFLFSLPLPPEEMRRRFPPGGHEAPYRA
jgi:EAL domain-containing protein (putative c-di-GMP-specific phosphodiesterase class I)